MKYKGKKICIICEGFEEEEYIGALVNKAVFSNQYDITIVNAKSNNNIMSIYEQKFQLDLYYLVLIFCDTDKAPYETYINLKQKINSFHGRDVAENVIIFGNPCTMQIILSHFSNIKLSSQSKKVNSKYIEQLTGIKDYDATKEQRKELFSKITKANYKVMKSNIAKLSTQDEKCPSTNILKYLEYFESNDDSWINEINERIYN